MNCIDTNISRLATQPRQRGASLIMVLLILLVITVMGISAAQISMLGERATRYDRDYQIALQAAEVALMDAEFDIRGPNTSGSARMTNFKHGDKTYFVDGCGAGSGSTQGLCIPSGTTKPIWASIDFLDETTTARSVALGTFTGRAFDAGSSGVMPSRKPRYVIEVLDDKTVGENAAHDPYGPGPSGGVVYRITAMGFGPDERTQAVLQIEFRKEKEL